MLDTESFSSSVGTVREDDASKRYRRASITTARCLLEAGNSTEGIARLSRQLLAPERRDGIASVPNIRLISLRNSHLPTLNPRLQVPAQ